MSEKVRESGFERKRKWEIHRDAEVEIYRDRVRWREK